MAAISTGPSCALSPEIFSIRPGQTRWLDATPLAISICHCVIAPSLWMAQPSSSMVGCWASSCENAELPRISVNEAVPAYLSRGAGEPSVVLLHGVGGGKAYWT